MGDADINTLMMEKYFTLTRRNQAPSVVKPEIRGNVNFEIKSQFIRELREDTFLGNKNGNAYEHVERNLDIITLFNISGVTHDAVMLHVFPITLTRAAKSIRVSNDSPVRIAVITNKLDSLGKDMKKLKENVHAIQVGCENCRGAHLKKDCPIHEASRKSSPPRYYTRVDNRLPFGKKKPSLEELMNKHIEKSTRKRAKMEEWMKKLQESTKLNTRNQNASLKNLETQIEHLAKDYQTKDANEVPILNSNSCRDVAVLSAKGTPFETSFELNGQKYVYLDTYQRPRISKTQFVSQVDVNNDLSKPVTTHYLPKERESALVKPHHVISSSESRNSSKIMSRFSSNDMVHNHYLEEAKKKIQERDRNSRPSVMPSAKSQSTTNGSKPKPRSNNQNSRNWPASKSGCISIFNANHDSCVTKFLKEVNLRAKVPSNKTTNINKPVEHISVAKQPERQILKGHRFSIKKTFVVHEKTMTPRSCLR
nr:hypothetical protein [Tanacetum cinerariifolium]